MKETVYTSLETGHYAAGYILVSLRNGKLSKAEWMQSDDWWSDFKDDPTTAMFNYLRLHPDEYEILLKRMTELENTIGR